MMKRINFMLANFWLILQVTSFVPPQNSLKPLSHGQCEEGIIKATVDETQRTITGKVSGIPSKAEKKKYWEILPTKFQEGRPLTPKLRKALETETHPQETQDELGRGVAILADWREAWFTYQSPPENPDLIDSETGYAEYECEVDGTLPNNLVGVLYKNGPGKFGVNGERVQHVLDADGLVYKMTFPSATDPETKRKVIFKSRFIETRQFKAERESNRFLYRSTFGTGPSSLFDSRPKIGVDSDPIEASILTRVLSRAFNVDIKNSANTQVISFGGKLLALFEAGLPHSLDPNTLETIGEDTLDGTLKSGVPVKLDIPSEFQPDFIGGKAHTAHPQVCPKSGNLVGWHWSQRPMRRGLEVTFTEWSPVDFKSVASNTFVIKNCELAPHDMAITENYIIMKVNAMQMDFVAFLSGLNGPAASLSMDGRAPVDVWMFPRPSAKNQFEPFSVKVPACFSIHFSHAYENSETGNIVTFFSGWPPSDEKDFLGAWAGFVPGYQQIQPTYLWRLEIDPKEQKYVSLNIAPGSANICIDHILVHPNFIDSRAENVYGAASNIVGDSSPPNGYVKLKVESGNTEALKRGTANKEVDVYWFGTRYFASEPLIVPKKGGNPDNEEEAFLLGMVRDAAKKKNFLAIFDLERDLSYGPICKIWIKSDLPHGLHGCFADFEGASSVFC